jgi:fructose-1,6-bisphosphatase/inositol monophosphatase family enzyme
MRGLTARQLQDLWLLMREAAEREILPRFRQLGAGAVRTKTGPLDLVTDADEAAERFITAGLGRLFPGAVVVGEEATAADPGLLRRIADADLSFVVDPVDGTANFAAGLPLFGVMAAAMVRGEIVASVIHDPIGGDGALALRGEGAWMEQPSGARADLRVAAAAPLERMTGGICRSRSGAAFWRLCRASRRPGIIAMRRMSIGCWRRGTRMWRFSRG